MQSRTPRFHRETGFLPALSWNCTSFSQRILQGIEGGGARGASRHPLSQPSRQPIVLRRVAHSRAANGLLDTVAIAVVHVAGGDAAAYAGQPVLSIVGQSHVLAAVDTPRRVAVGVVPILLHPADVGHRVLVRTVLVGQGRALEARDVARIAVGIAALSVADVGSRAAGLGCAQPIQGVVAEALRLAPAIGRRIADLQHVAHVVVGVADVLQIGVGIGVASLQARQAQERLWLIRVGDRWPWPRQSPLRRVSRARARLAQWHRRRCR